jgi:trk system potassium uptake protein TrkH
MQEAVTTLFHAVRPRVVAKYLGQLALMLALLALAPLLVSVFYGEYFYTLRYLVVIILLLVLGIPAVRLAEPDDIQANESLVITALAFVLSPLLMTWPMMAAGLPFADAWFEAVSGITTTGLSTLQSLADRPKTFLFARAWMQWYGGLGIVVLSVALLMGHHIALRRLVGPEAGQSMLTTTRIYARRVLRVYLSLTVVGVIILWLLLQDGFLALTHVLAAVSTGGFSSLGGSLGDMDHWSARAVIILLGLCGALPFALYYQLFRGNWRDVVFDTELRILLLLTLIISALLSLSLAYQFDFGWQQALRHGLLLGTSAQTTTGFSSLDIATLSPVSKGLLIIAMFIGGDMGSTAGGIKILRLLIMARMIQLFIQRSTLPAHAVIEPRIGERALEPEEITQALVLILLFVIVIAFSWLVFLAYGYPALDALFEVVSASGTVGLSTGITRHGLEPLLKLVLGVDMLLGRLEIIALLVVLYPHTWIGKRTT